MTSITHTVLTGSSRSTAHILMPFVHGRELSHSQPVTGNARPLYCGAGSKVAHPALIRQVGKHFFNTPEHQGKKSPVTMQLSDHRHFVLQQRRSAAVLLTPDHRNLTLLPAGRRPCDTKRPYELKTLRLQGAKSILCHRRIDWGTDRLLRMAKVSLISASAIYPSNLFQDLTDEHLNKSICH